MYITPHKPGTPFALPTKTRYQWRSLFVGSDSVTVTYEDPHFCVDCDYIIGVYGYHNSTYTLMATDQEDAIIKLVQNRPQVAAIGERDGTLFFSAVIASSAADMTVTLTSIGTGVADLYVAVYNATTFYSPAGGDVYRLPDPSLPSSYQYTNAGTEDDHVFIRGPHWQESIVVILVKGTVLCDALLTTVHPSRNCCCVSRDHSFQPQALCASALSPPHRRAPCCCWPACLRATS